MSDDDFQQLFSRIADRTESVLSASPACHDWEHTMRVLHNARLLAEAEGADRKIVDLAAVLHDVGRPAELGDKGKTCHAQEGAKIAHRFLQEAGVDDSDFVDSVTACVRTHRYRRRNGEKPETIEAKVVFDADKLDCIGAVGIGRAFHFAGRIGAALHNTEEAALGSESYSSEDSAYREYLVKLRHVRERMLTDEGRNVAAQRHDFMVQFFDRICREVRGHDLI